MFLVLNKLILDMKWTNYYYINELLWPHLMYFQRRMLPQIDALSLSPVKVFSIFIFHLLIYLNKGKFDVTCIISFIIIGANVLTFCAARLYKNHTVITKWCKFVTFGWIVICTFMLFFCFLPAFFLFNSLVKHKFLTFLW